MNRPALRPVLAALILLLCANAAQAERIVLKRGRTIEGQIVAQDAQTVTVQTVTSRLVLRRADIERIEPSEPGEAELQSGEEAFRRGDLAAARRFFSLALERGMAKERVDGRIAEIERIRREQELAANKAAIDSSLAAMQAGNFEAAKATLTELAGKLAPDNPIRDYVQARLADAHLGMAQTYRDRVNTQAAQRELNEVLRLDPARWQAYIELGGIYMQTSRTYNEAIGVLETGLELGGSQIPTAQRAKTHFELAMTYVDMDRPLDANRHLRAVYAISPQLDSRIEPRMEETALSSIAPMIRSNPEEALKLLELNIAAKPTPALLQQRGEILMALGRKDEAVEAYTRLLEIAPRTRDIHYRLGLIYRERNAFLEARDHYQKEIGIDAEHYGALCELADLAMLRDDIAQAEEFFKRGFEARPELTRALLGLGQVARRNRKLDKETRLKAAENFIDQVLALERNNRAANLEKGLLMRDREQFDRASDFFTQVLNLISDEEKKPDLLPAERSELQRLRADAHLARGEVRLLTTGPATANNDFNAALSVLPNYPAAFYNIGLAYKSKFDLSKVFEDALESERNIIKARQLDPRNPGYALALGVLYQRTLAQVRPEEKDRYLDEARRQYREYIELGGSDASTVKGYLRELGG